MKRWDPAHLRLATAVVDVREQLRRLLPSLPADAARVVGGCAAALTVALKARSVKRKAAV